MSVTTLEQYTFEYLMSQALAQVPDNMDKRQGSIIYDALAPACYVLADMYMQMRNVYVDTYIETASEDSLDSRVLERGVTRYAATQAVKRADFKDSSNNALAVRVGDRFSSISDTDPITYVVTGEYKVEDVAVPGAYLLTCEEYGTIGNTYTGDLLNISYVRGVASAVMSTLITSARDEETDSELRDRYIQLVTDAPFGGNVSQYRIMIKELSGVKDVQVYPVWNGGGTVKCSIINSSYQPIPSETITSIQEQVDPSVSGEGLGLAPIGHHVTITTPTSVTINVAATLTLASGFTIQQVQSLVEDAIQSYITELCTEWGTPDALNNYSLSVYLSRVIACILSVSGISNVSGVTINSSAADLVLTENSTTQQIPSLGTVTLS